MPHRVGGSTCEEKVRAEAANYAYVDASCPAIPIAGLIGFGFRDCHYTHQDYLGFFQRMFHCTKRLWQSIWYRQALPRYAQRHRDNALDMPYMLLDFIEPQRGRMLSDYLQLLQNEEDPRGQNLYRSLSRMVISPARQQWPHIGALRFDDNGSIRLAGLPSLCGDEILSNETGLNGLDRIYTFTERSLYDILAFRDHVLRASPKAVNDEENCRLQMAHSVLLRAMIPQLVDHEAPFVLHFTDLHASNIFVDKDWNITGVIDLEFMRALPTSMLDVPYWLSGTHLDAIDPEKHARVHAAFMEIFQREEHIFLGQTKLSRAIQESWTSWGFWLYHAVISVNALPMIMEDHLWRLFGFRVSATEEQMFLNRLSLFCSRESGTFVAQKVAEKKAYARDIQQLFDDAA